jgi:hypothetical protein
MSLAAVGRDKSRVNEQQAIVAEGLLAALLVVMGAYALLSA